MNFHPDFTSNLTSNPSPKPKIRPNPTLDIKRHRK